MNRSHLASSRVLSVPERIDKWSSSIHPTHIDKNLESTISLVQNLANPLMGIYLITDKLTNIQNNAFVEIMRSVLDQLETMCQNLMIENLKRVSQGKPLIISSISTFKDTQEKNIYRASMLLTNLFQKRVELSQQSSALEKIKSYRYQIEPQQEDNQQLMKFFEGVRRYQDHQDKRALVVTQKLKKHKDNVLRKRQINRGFELFKMQKALTNAFNKSKSLLFKYRKRGFALNNLIKISESYQNRLVQDSFIQMIAINKRKNISELLKQYRNLIVKKQLSIMSKQLKSFMFKKMNKRTSLRKIQMIFQQKQTNYKTILLEYFKSKIKVKLLTLSKTFMKLSDSFLNHYKRKYFKKWTLRTHHKVQVFVGKLKTIFWKRIDQALNRIETQLIQNKRPILSDRTKGKIVASVIRVKHQDINLRQSLLKWWLKAKPEAVEKRFMHMFLYAPTRPFTYFLRLKNMVKQSKVPKVSPKSILFVMLIKQKTQKFLKYKERNAIQKWDKWNKMIKVMVKMIKNISKLQVYTNQQLTKHTFRTLLQMFDQYNNRKRLMMRIFNVIGGTGIGKVFKAVQIWKKLPDNKELKKKHMMLATINKALASIRKQVKNSFEYFKQCYLVGQEKKRSAALIMLRSAGGSVSQSFKKWQDSMRINKTITKCKAISSFLQSVSVVVGSQYGTVFENPRQAYLRQKYLTRLILTQTGNISKYFTILVNALKAARMNDNIQQKQRKLLVSRISNMIGNQNATGIKTALQKLYVNMKVKQKQINFMKRLMQTKGGKLFESIRIWKDLPQKNRFSKVRNGHRFFSVLKRLADKSLIYIFKQFIDDYQSGQIRKRRAMGVLMSMTSSDIRKYYVKWHADTKKRKILAQCSTAMSFMESVNDVIKGNMTIMLQSQRASMLKQKCINKMILNVGGGVKTFLIKWMKVAKELTLQNKINNVQRKHYINIITNGISNKKSDLVKYAIASLSKNMRMKRIAKSFFNKLMQTQSGMVIRAIQCWHAIPPKDVNKKKQRAIKFQKVLQDMAEKVMRFSYNQFKTEQLYGQSKQKYILNKLVKRCMSYEQKKYIHWKVVTKQLALLQKARLVMKSFENIQCTIKSSFQDSLIGETKSDLGFKGKLISDLVRNNTSVMQLAFSNWRGWYQNIKNNNRYHKLSRLIQIWDGKRFKKEVLNTILQQKQLQTQRTYINSLWRWKTSQFQAEYYNKFLQMFNESQVLLTFSKILNNRIFGTLMYGFTKIRQVKNQQQFKYNIVKKYFLKRLSSYFERFKQQVKGREIERWRYKFQDSIRGMLMLQALQKAIKKIRSYQLKNWRNKTKKYFKWRQAMQKVSNIPLSLKQYSFTLIKRNMQSGRIQLGSKILKSYQNNNKLQAFNRIYKMSKLSKIVSILDVSWKNTQKTFISQLQLYSKLQGSNRQGLMKLNKLMSAKQSKINKQFMNSAKKIARNQAIIQVLDNIGKRKQLQQKKRALNKLKQQAHNAKILVKYQAAQRMFGVYQKIHRYSVNRYLSIWRKLIKDSIWLKKSVQMIATKPSLKSSLAISMWRMKVYSQKRNAQ